MDDILNRHMYVQVSPKKQADFTTQLIKICRVQHLPRIHWVLCLLRGRRVLHIQGLARTIHMSKLSLSQAASS